MTWLNPAAVFAGVLAAAPVLIHLLVHRHAERFAYPTLRFIRPTRLAAIRRHVLEDLLLLAVRVAIIAAAVAAFAAPLVIGAARRAEWNARTTRAIVIQDPTGNSQPAAGRGGAFRIQEFRVKSIADGVHRAAAWLRDSPPARRELVIAGPLVLGSIHEADLADIPPDVGIRFERIGTLPAERYVETPPVLTIAGTERRTVTLEGPASLVQAASGTARERWPIEIVAPASLRPAIDAAVEAVLSQRVPTAPADRPVKVILLQRGAPAAVQANAIGTPWMADAIARIARDVELRDEARNQMTGFADTRFSTRPWYPLASAADGRGLISAAATGGTLTIVSAASADAVVTPVLLRSIANSIAPDPDFSSLEIVPIADSVLGAWTRAPGAVLNPRIDTVERDDRRWLWLAALALLAVETWLRRGRRQDIAVAVEESRVA